MYRLPSDVADLLRRAGTLIVPSRPRAHAVRLAHAAAQLAGERRVWERADVQTPSAWTRRECTRRAEAAPHAWPRILSATEEWLLWRIAARDAAGDTAFLDAGLLGESLRRASERAVDYGVTLRSGSPASEPALLARAEHRFAALCRDLNAASVAALSARLLEAPAPGALLLRGFDSMPPRLAALAAAHGAPATEPAAGREATTRRVLTEDAESQMEAIAAWCCARLEAEPDARLLVILPGPAGERERLASLIRGGLDPAAALAQADDVRPLAAIEGGARFGTLPLPTQGLLGLSILAGSDVDPDEMAHWLTSPYWESPSAVMRATLALQVRQSRLARVGLAELLGVLQMAPRTLRSAARELISRLQRAARRLTQGSADPRRWSERFEAALAVLGWPGELPPDSAVHQARLRWRKLLDEFGELTATTGTLPRGDACDLLRALAVHSLFRPADEDVPVTISPLLADPVVLYDGIWVGGLHAAVLPEAVATDPFLPFAAQLAAGVPEASAAGRRAQAQALLAAWSRSTPELRLSVPAREGDLALLPSPCLTGIESTGEARRTLWLPKRLHRDSWLESVEDSTGTAVGTPKPLGGTRLVTLQNSCAFRAYAELRLGAAPPELPQPGVPPDQRGRLLHAALQGLWDRLHDSHSLRALPDPALDALIAECVEEGVRAVHTGAGRRRRGRRRIAEGQFELFAELPPALARECARARRLVRALCDLERKRAPFTVEAAECDVELVLGSARLQLRIDRIDRLVGGARAVLDYKSGRPGTQDWYGERPTHPQLLAYLVALGEDVAALATVNLTAHEVRFKGVAARDGLLPQVKPLSGGPPAAPDWRTQQQLWQGLIARLVRAYLAGDARVDPAPGACDYCHVTDICRIGAHAGPEAPEHAERADE